MSAAHKRRGPNTDGHTSVMSHTCECGKFAYLTRKDARATARRAHPNESMSQYQCGGYWHIGHLPVHVVNGSTPRLRDGEQ